ncbi:MAG: PqqD family peptide modification chaperone [Methylobacter sp.]
MSENIQHPRFSVRLFQDHLVVNDALRQELFVLNPTASILWFLLEDNCYDANDLSTALTQLIDNVDAAVVDHDVQATLQAWSSLGWLDMENSGYRLVRSFCEPGDPFGGRATQYPPATALPHYEIISDLHLSLNQNACRVILGHHGRPGFPDATFRLQAVLAGLASDDATADSNFVLRLIDAGDRFWIDRPDTVLSTNDESFALASIVTGIFNGAYAEDGLFATVHAAAVSKPGGTLLLPGASGHGKSTLTAYLTAHDWNYLGDDVVALGQKSSGDEITLLPFPTALGLKPASWPIMHALYPELENLPTIPYADKQARFIPLPRTIISEPSQLRIRAVIFPNYAVGQATLLEAIEPIQAFCLLVESGLTTGSSIESKRIDTLLELLERTPCYRITYSNLSEVEQTFQTLLS